MRRDSHMLHQRDKANEANDANDANEPIDVDEDSTSPPAENDFQSDQESEVQNDSINGRKGPAQRRRFSQRTKTGCQ
jgi:hypothetical protein